MNKEIVININKEGPANVSLDGLARSFRIVENGNAEGTFACAAVVGNILYRDNSRTWNYRDLQSAVSPKMMSRVGITLSALSALSITELGILGIDSPTRAMKNSARSLLKSDCAESLNPDVDIQRIKELACLATSSVSEYSTYASAALKEDPELRKRIDDIAWTNYQTLTPGQQQAIQDQAALVEIDRMKRSVVYTEEFGDEAREYDEFTLAIESIVGRSPGLSKRDYDLAKQKAVNTIVLTVGETVSKADLLEIMIVPYISRMSQEAGLATVREIIVNAQPDFVPWLSNNEDTDTQLNLSTNDDENQKALRQQLLRVIEEEEKSNLDQILDGGISKPQEFSEYPPDEEEINQVVEQVINNRLSLLARAEEFGLDPVFLQYRQGSFIVGPFVSPAPIPTTFAGIVDNFVFSANVGAKLTEKLTESGIRAQQYAVVNLAMTEMPSRGKEAMDCVVIPKKATGNQRLPIAGKNNPGEAYGSVEISTEDIATTKKRLREAFYIYTGRFPTLRLEKRGSVIVDKIISDIEEAYSSSQSKTVETRSYLDFSVNLNRIMAIRAGQPDLESVFVDTAYYAPFLRDGIADIEKFIGKLDQVGFFEDDPNFIKIVDKGKSRILKLKRMKNGDAILNFKDNGEEVLFSVLQKSGIDIAPCKELTYILCMANIVPVVYGDINSGYYEPYAVAKKRVEQLGFSPVLYRTQPKISDRYEDIDTVFDFYRQLLFT